MKKKRTERSHQPDYKPGRAALIWAEVQAQRRRRRRQLGQEADQ